MIEATTIPNQDSAVIRSENQNGKILPLKPNYPIHPLTIDSRGTTKIISETNGEKQPEALQDNPLAKSFDTLDSIDTPLFGKYRELFSILRMLNTMN